MSPFAIFTTVLTVAYVIYYAFIITKDLYGIKQQPKADTESFDVSDMEEEEAPISVSEHPDNFTNSEEEEMMEVISEDGIRIFKPNTVADDNNTPSEKEDKTTSEQLNEEHSEGMEDIETESIFTLDSAEFGDYLTQKHIENKRKLTKTNVIDNL